jgi:hypothetical protein
MRYFGSAGLLIHDIVIYIFYAFYCRYEYNSRVVIRCQAYVCATSVDIILDEMYMLCSGIRWCVDDMTPPLLVTYPIPISLLVG